MAAVAFSCSKATSEQPVERDEIVFIPTLSETKANLIPAGDMIGKNIHVDGYIAGSESKHLDGDVIYDNFDDESANTWVFYKDGKLGVHYYWPQNSNLDILAYSPADLQNTFVSIASSKTVTCNNLPVVDTLQKGSLLNEFVCGYKADCGKDDGPISVTLKRPFALIKFYLDEAVRCNVNNIKVQGIYNCGTYNASTSKWSELSNSSELICSVNKKYPDPLNNGSELSDSLVVIPQSMRVGTEETDPVKLTFSYTSVGNTVPTITETTIGQASGTDGKKVTAWEPGKVYEYYLTLNGAANECRMTVKIGKWSKQGEVVVDVE